MAERGTRSLIWLFVYPCLEERAWQHAMLVCYRIRHDTRPNVYKMICTISELGGRGLSRVFLRFIMGKKWNTEWNRTRKMAFIVSVNLSYSVAVFHISSDRKPIIFHRRTMTLIFFSFQFFILSNVFIYVAAVLF